MVKEGESYTIALDSDYMDTNITIYCDGKTVTSFDAFGTGSETITKTGVYTIEVGCGNMFGDTELVFTVTKN